MCVPQALACPRLRQQHEDCSRWAGFAYASTGAAELKKNYTQLNFRGTTDVRSGSDSFPTLAFDIPQWTGSLQATYHHKQHTKNNAPPLSPRRKDFALHTGYFFCAEYSCGILRIVPPTSTLVVGPPAMSPAQDISWKWSAVDRRSARAGVEIINGGAKTLLRCPRTPTLRFKTTKSNPTSRHRSSCACLAVKPPWPTTRRAPILTHRCGLRFPTPPVVVVRAFAA